MNLRRQPLLGIASALAIILISLLFIAAFDWSLFRDWVSVYLMCAIPFTVVVGGMWHGQHPAAVARLRQPLKGLTYLVSALVVAAIVMGFVVAVIGQGVTPPTPMAAQYVIISVPIALGLVIAWGSWPFTLIKRPMLGGVTLLIAVYAIAAAVFYTLMNFDWLQGAPFYQPGLDPSGAFDSWTVLVFIVTTLAALFLILHFQLWPLTKRAAMMRQPLLGLTLTVISLAIAAIVTYLGLHVAGMTAPEYLTTVPVPFLFGSIVTLNILEGGHLGSLAQPLRGLVSAVFAAALGLFLAWIYVALAQYVTGDLAWGPPTFDGQIWLASALLAVTFPFLAFHADFFGLWPLRERTEEASAEPAPSANG